MNFLWCDTETTGLRPEDAGAFEVAFIFVMNNNQSKKLIGERVFRFNPLNDKILYHESARLVHGISEAEIRSLPPADKIVPNIAEFLYEAVYKFGNREKLCFAGYNCSFDLIHLDSLFKRFGFNIGNYISSQFCVKKMTKKAMNENLIPKLENLKLTTVCKALNVPLKNPHQSLADIRATREVAIKLWKQGASYNYE